MTELQKECIRVCTEIEADCERDARSLDGELFNGRMIGARLGEIYAMISMLARVVSANVREGELNHQPFSTENHQ